MDLQNRFLFQCDNLPTLCYARLKNMKQQGQFCDITINFGNRSISAHRLILSAAIPYFCDMLANAQSANDLRELNMEEIDPGALESLIDFAYSCQVEITLDNVHSLLRASCSLNVEEVRDACCDFIGKRLNSENVLFTRKMAEELSCSSLVETADSLICENFDEMAKTDEFLSMLSDFLMKLLTRDDLRTESEENVFQVVMKWIKASPGERKDKLPELLEKVRLIFLTPDYLMDHVHTEEYIQSSIPCRDLLDRVKFYQSVPHMRTKLVDVEKKARVCPERDAKITGSGIDGIYTLRKCFEVQYFDPENEKWEVVASTPVEHFCTLIGNSEKLILVEADIMWWCSLPDCKWEGGAVFVGRIGFGAAIIDNYVFICGGRETCARGGRETCALDVVERVDLLTNTSQKDTPMSVPRNFLGVVRIGGYLYALGGHNGRTVYDSVEKFDPKINKWKFLSPMKSKRYGMGCTTMNNKIYVCGGISVYGAAFLSSAEVYDPFTDQWNCISSMESARCVCSLVNYCGRLYALGGYDTQQVYLCSAEVYHQESDQWKIGPEMDCSHEHATAVRFPSVSN